LLRRSFALPLFVAKKPNLLAERHRTPEFISGDRYCLPRKVVRTLGIKRIRPVVISEK